MPKISRSDKRGNENALVQTAGGVAGILGDVLYNTLRIPGYNAPSAIQGLSLGDIVQFLGSYALTAYGFAQGNSRIAPFGFGAMMSQVATKVIFPAFDLPRYLIFDIDSSGRIVPTRQFK